MVAGQFSTWYGRPQQGLYGAVCPCELLNYGGHGLNPEWSLGPNTPRQDLQVPRIRLLLLTAEVVSGVAVT